MAQKGMKRVFLTKLTEEYSTDKEGIGTVRREGDDEFVYVKAGEAIADGAAAVFGSNASSAYTAKLAGKAAKGGRVGLAKVALTASYYGWLQVRGRHAEGLLASDNSVIAAGDKVYVDDSAGTLDQSASSAAQLIGAFFQAVRGASSATNTTVPVVLNHPYIDG